MNSVAVMMACSAPLSKMHWVSITKKQEIKKEINIQMIKNREREERMRGKKKSIPALKLRE